MGNHCCTPFPPGAPPPAAPPPPPPPSNAVSDDPLPPPEPLHVFSYSDLKAATGNFHNLLGKGGFGPVYRGWIDEKTYLPIKAGQGRPIAVKCLNRGGSQGHAEWLNEVSFLGRLHHPNLVKLIGHCNEDNQRLLVYEYMQRGSLDMHLFDGRTNLPWPIRMKIIIGAARGLAFLHSLSVGIIYRDFKAANILMDSHFNAKLSDFGLAKDGPTGDDTHVSTRIVGTYGYAAPEYLATGHLRPKSDVYSFGVFLLEMLAGRRVVLPEMCGAEQNLVEWSRPFLDGGRKFTRIIDAKLKGQYPFKAAQVAVGVVKACLSLDAKLRPSMAEVLESLEPLLDAKQLSKCERELD